MQHFITALYVINIKLKNVILLYKKKERKKEEKKEKKSLIFKEFKIISLKKCKIILKLIYIFFAITNISNRSLEEK